MEIGCLVVDNDKEEEDDDDNGGEGTIKMTMMTMMNRQSQMTTTMTTMAMSGRIWMILRWTTKRKKAVIGFNIPLDLEARRPTKATSPVYHR